MNFTIRYRELGEILREFRGSVDGSRFRSFVVKEN